MQASDKKGERPTVRVQVLIILIIAAAIIVAIILSNQAYIATTHPRELHSEEETK